jgi:hypothetical protein
MCPNDRNAVGWGAGGRADLGRPCKKSSPPTWGGRRFGAAKAVPQALSDAFRAAHGPAASAKQPPARSAETAPGNTVGWQQKKHTSGAHVCNIGSCPRPHGSKQTKKMKHPNLKSEPGPCQEISMLYGLGAEPPLPPRVFDHFSASAVNSVWIGPFFDQKDPPTVRCAWEAVRSLFTLKNAASHPPTLTGYIIWG